MTKRHLDEAIEKNMMLVDQMLDILADTVDVTEYDRFVNRLVNLAYGGHKHHERLAEDLRRLKRFGAISCCYC